MTQYVYVLQNKDGGIHATAFSRQAARVAKRVHDNVNEDKLKIVRFTKDGVVR